MPPAGAAPSDQPRAHPAARRAHAQAGRAATRPEPCGPSRPRRARRRGPRRWSAAVLGERPWPVVAGVRDVGAIAGQRGRRGEQVNVVHGNWSVTGELCLWAEDSTLPPKATARRRVKSPKAPVGPHPFACPPETLRQALALVTSGAPVGELAGKAEARELTLLLPSAASGPLASPELVRAPPQDGRGSGARADGRGVTLGPWRVPALALHARDAPQLL